MNSSAWFPNRPIMVWLAKDRWQMHHDYIMPVGRGCVVIPEGFLTDLASVPHPLRSLIDEQALGASAIGHDFLYQHGGRYSVEPPLTRCQVDRQFREWMKTEKVARWRRTAAYLAVRLAGWACWHRSKKGTRRV